MAKPIFEKVLSEMLTQHPDVAQQTKLADIITRLAGNPWLGGFASYHGLDVVRTVTAELCYAFDWGIRFEAECGHPPEHDDWLASYYDRANAFAECFGVQCPYDKPNNRLRFEYGGPF
jgi:hypothetical protein